MSSVMIYFKYLIKTILSNISPNKSIFNVIVVCIRTFLLNLKYSFKIFINYHQKFIVMIFQNRLFGQMRLLI